MAITILDSLDFIVAESWPKAIHEGNGTALLLVSSEADEEQKKGNHVVVEISPKFFSTWDFAKMK